MLAEGIHHHRRQRHGALAGCRLEAAHDAVAIGALAHMQLAGFQIDVLPAQSAQFRCPQTGKDRRQEHRPPSAVEMRDEPSDFVR